MKTSVLFKQKFNIVMGLLLLVLGAQQSFAQEICTSAGVDRKYGDSNGYHYELWNLESKGAACITLGGKAPFSGRWLVVDNYLTRRGLLFDETKKHNEIGYFNAFYDANYKPGCEARASSYMGFYGWMVDPLVEYYVIENWCNWNPSLDANAVSLGFHYVDDVMYQVVKVSRSNQPSIKGPSTNFTQYINLRYNIGTRGNVSITKHFKLWESLGLPMGKMHEMSFAVEGYKGSGNFSLSKLDITKSLTPFVPQTGVDLLPSSLQLRLAQRTKLNVSVLPANATEKRVEFESSDPRIVTVNSNGVVTATGYGTAYVTAWTYDRMHRDTSVITVVR